MAIRILIGTLCVSVLFITALFNSSTSPAVNAALSQIAVPTPVPNETPRFSDYRGITLGMPAADARAKLGVARDSSDQEDFYVISDGETCQLIYQDKLVKAISTTYTGSGSKAPTPNEIFGMDVEAKPDGSINKLVKYPKVGFWISYIRTDGTDPMTMVTVHKLQKGEF
ncbi:MAG: hypothetical protein ABJA02_03395 [Acidobacteriota bacterium]